MIRRLIATLIVALASVGAAAADLAERPGRLPPGVVPLHYDIHVEPDAQAMTLTGRVTIDVDVQHPAPTITLNAADLDITRATLDGTEAARVSLNPAAQTATLTFAGPVEPGRHRLVLDYRGKVNSTAAGLFAVDYDTPDGPRRMLSTQFEAPDARRFAPMWDEPSARATFALEVVVPAGQTAVSNMPEAEVRSEDGRRIVRFATSPKMSSYLLHLTVGELERISRDVGGVDVGVVTRKGAGESGRFALDAAAEILPWYDDYFGTRYPLPKLDMIAVPGSSQFFGAMENWGAIMYFEPALLVDPRFASERDRQGVFSTVAHEVAHQWFGDLVTMQWWDDLWLNEGYATWMDGKITSVLHPSWKPALQIVNGARERALRLDAGPATHPVVQVIPTVDAASQAFDTIAYSKGSSVIRMLEDWLGEGGFREGMRRYMRKYAYRNTVTDQLWAELAAATGRPVADVAHDFTLQPGVPLVAAAAGKCEGDRTPVTLTQDRFETGAKSAQRLTWRIPVRLRALEGDGRAFVMLPKDGKPVQVSIAGCGAVIVNAGQAGYFRTRYAAADLDRLRGDLARIPEVDQLGLLNDTWALGEAGRVPVAAYLGLAEVVPADSDPLILQQVASTYERIDRLFDGSKEQEAWRVFARGELRPIFERVGWLPGAGEPETVALLRDSLIRTLGRLGEPSVVAEARDRFARAPKEPDALPATIRQAILRVVALHADAATWDEIRRRANAAQEPIEKQRLFIALGSALDPVLAMRALELALTEEPPTTYAAGIIESVSADHPELAFGFALAHEAEVLELVEVSSKWAYIPELAYTSADAAMAGKVRAYMEQSVPKDAWQAAERAIAEIEYRAAVRSRQLPALEDWIRGNQRARLAAPDAP